MLLVGTLRGYPSARWTGIFWREQHAPARVFEQPLVGNAYYDSVRRYPNLCVRSFTLTVPKLSTRTTARQTAHCMVSLEFKSCGFNSPISKFLLPQFGHVEGVISRPWQRIVSQADSPKRGDCRSTLRETISTDGRQMITHLSIFVGEKEVASGVAVFDKIAA